MHTHENPTTKWTRAKLDNSQVKDNEITQNPESEMDAMTQNEFQSNIN